MRPSYKRDIEHNYMILESPIKVQGSEYQIRMLLLNQIPGLLPCNMRIMDGMSSFYYEITSRQPLTRIYEVSQMKREDIASLITGIRKGINGMKSYLLNPDHLVLEPDYIYMEPETREIWLCCLPFYEGQITEGFRILAEFVLKHLDHSDSEAVVWGYEIYSEASKENYSLDTILQSVYAREYAERKESVKDVQYKPEEEQPQENYQEEEQSILPVSDQENTQKMKRKINWVVPAASVLILAAAAGASMAVDLNLTQMGGVLFLVGGIAVYFMQIRGDKKTDKGKAATKEPYRKKGDKKKGRYEEGIYREHREEEDRIEDGSGSLIREDYMQGIVGTEEYGETELLYNQVTEGFAALISENPQKRESIVLRDQISSVGKLKGKNDIVIPLPEVSRIHARIERKEEGYYLTDSNSRNGTYVNGVRLEANETVKLKDGDMVGFASALFFFQE